MRSLTLSAETMELERAREVDEVYEGGAARAWPVVA